MATTIVTKNGSGAPTDSDLVAGELAVDLTNGRLYTTDLDSGGTVIEIGLNPSGNVDVTGTVTADGLTVDTTTLVVDATNNRVGIGTSSPSATLHVNGDSIANTFKLIANTVVSGSDATIFRPADNTMAFSTAGSERMRIDSSGRQIIGHTASVGTAYQTNLQVKGSTASNYGGLGVISTNNEMLGVVGTWSNGENSLMIAADPDNLRPSSSIVLTTDGTEAMRIDASGNVGIGVVPSVWSTGAGVRGLEVGANLAASQDINSIYFSANAYNSATGWKYRNTQYASNLRMGTNDGVFEFQRAASGTAGAAITWATSMTLDANGNVGIGRTPDANGVLQLNVAAGLNTNLTFAENSVNKWMIGSLTSSNALRFYDLANSREAMRIDSSGNLLVGKSSSSTSGAGTFIETTSIGHARINLTSENTTATVVSFYYDNGTTATQVGTIVTSTTATTYNTSSDQRLKENIVDAPSASDDIDAIQVRSFDWKADGSHQKYGMVAQELQTVAPEAVSGDADSEEMMGVDYSKLVPMLVKEIQSLRARVAQLES